MGLLFSPLYYFLTKSPVSISNFQCTHCSVMPRMGPCSPSPPPPYRPVGLLGRLGFKMLGLSWSSQDHYCTHGGGLKTATLVPHRQLTDFCMMLISNISNIIFGCLAGIKNFTVTVTVSVKSKHRISLFRYRSEITETNCLKQTEKNRKTRKKPKKPGKP